MAEQSPVPDYLEPIVGWRIWHVTPAGKVPPRIVSVNVPLVWEPYRPCVACQFGDADCAVIGRCDCAIYAFKDAQYARVETSGLDGPRIIGQVWLWGWFAEHQHGWRAQFAYPKMFLVPYTRWKIAKPLSEEYNVPFKLYNLERKH